MPTITMIGAGSITFTRRLYNDIIAQPELRESTVRMVDMDEEKLAAIVGYAQEVARPPSLVPGSWLAGPAAVADLNVDGKSCNPEPHIDAWCNVGE